MTTWSHTVEPVLLGRARKFAVLCDGSPLPYSTALRLLRDDSAFRAHLTDLIASCEYSALRWETPPITAQTIDRPFEFVLVNDASLEMDPEPGVFGPYFDGESPERLVAVVPNLGRTAMMVVPRGISEPAAYTHFGAFLRQAPEAQVHTLWQCVAETALSKRSAAPLWISTAGGGVAWLHVRLEGEPKYYAYRPYAHAAQPAPSTRQDQP